MTSVAITTIDGSPTGLPTTVEAGKTVNVAAEITYEDGSTANKLTDDPRIAWKSADTASATVTAGVITGVATTATGKTADITVSAGGKTSAPLPLTVTAAPTEPAETE